MRQVARTQELLPSVLDRLINPKAGSNTEYTDSRVTVMEIRHSIRRDLENLLNTRRRFEVSNKKLDSKDLTIVNYGIPDFTGASFSTEDEQEELLREIRKIILCYEKRFKSLKIVEKKGLDSMDRSVRFRIEAELRVEPAVEPLVFDTHIDSVSRELSVEESSNG
ncbi:MAG: type VI secretion system baseplate subunit TssE [Gammaproteobacteria bacterium]|nr:type VI secretion system baseplate subunit TssE [Gammaproteobacteria bacterium]